MHAETSTGVRNDVEPLGAGKGDALLLVDCVTSLGGIPVEIDGWGVDIAYSGTQKCLGVPPGLAPLTVSDRAPRAVRRASRESWYLDLRMIGDYVGPQRRRYHHTAPISMIYALHAGLGVLLDEGLEASWARHERCGRTLQEGLEKLGFDAVRRRRATGCPSSPTAWLPEGLDDAADAAAALLDRYGIEVGGGLGPFAGQGVAHRLHGPHGAAAQRHAAARRARRGAGAVSATRAVAPATPTRRPPPTSAGSWPPTASPTSTSSCAGRSTTRSGSGTRSCDFLGLQFATPYSQVLDTSDGIPWARWFTGGTTNLAHNCVDHWAATGARAHGDRVGGRGRRRAHLDLRRAARPGGRARRPCSTSAASGRRRGGIFLPMLPETVAALLAVAKLGAVFLPLFSGYGADAVATRLDDAEAKALITADGFLPPGCGRADGAGGRARRWPTCPTVHDRGRRAAARRRVEQSGPEVLWPRVTDRPFATRPSTASTRCSSPTRRARRARPKGSVHVHGGFMVKVAEEGAFQIDCGAERPPVLVRRLGLDHGARGRSSAALANGATRLPVRGRARLPRPRPAVGVPRAPPGHRSSASAPR